MFIIIVTTIGLSIWMTDMVIPLIVMQRIMFIIIANIGLDIRITDTINSNTNFY